MMPMVFCASLTPWPSEYSEAEMNWKIRNPRSTANGVRLTKIQDTASTSPMASTKPSSGESTMAAAVFDSPPQTTTPTPALAMPARSRRPISACELLDGMPKNHVTRFQTMAPVSAPNTTRASTICASTMPVPSVCATCRPNTRKAMKLKNAAQATAYCGRSTRVDTMVATEFAASWKPLRKSNAKASAISATSSGRASVAVCLVAAPGRSHVIEDDAGDLVGHVVEAVDHFFQMVVDLVADDERHRVGSCVGAVELTQPVVVDVVGAALDLGDALGDAAEAGGLGADRAEQRHCLLDQAGRFHDRVAHLPHLRRERAQVEQDDGLGGGLHLVDGVVHRRDQVLDVDAIERRDEGPAYRDQHFAGGLVGVPLALHHDPAMLLDGLASLQHGAQRLGAGADGVRVPLEQIEEALFPRQQRVKPAQHSLPSPIRGVCAVNYNRPSAASLPARRMSRGFFHLFAADHEALTKCAKRRRQRRQLGGMLRIENSTDFFLVPTDAPAELGFADARFTERLQHRQLCRDFRRHRDRHEPAPARFRLGQRQISLAIAQQRHCQRLLGHGARVGLVVALGDRLRHVGKAHHDASAIAGLEQRTENKGFHRRALASSRSSAMKRSRFAMA